MSSWREHRTTWCAVSRSFRTVKRQAVDARDTRTRRPLRDRLVRRRASRSRRASRPARRTPGSIGVSACPPSPMHARRSPVTGCSALRPHGQPHQKHGDRREPERRRARPGADSICSSGTGESISIIEPKIRLTTPPTVEQAVAGDLDLEHQQQQAEEHQQQAGVVDRQHLEREERQQQAEAADDARQHRARVPQLDRRARACRGSAAGTRCSDGRWRSARAAAGSSRSARPWRAAVCSVAVRAVEARDGAAVELLQQIAGRRSRRGR